MGSTKTRSLVSFFFQGSINGDNYLNMLRTEAIPALAAASGNSQPFWMQDGAPAHYRTDVRAYLDAQFPGRWIGRKGPIARPARSPDLTPCDFFLWGHIKHQVFLTEPRDIDDLKDRITRACRAISPIMCENSRRAFYDRLGYCLVENGQHFGHKL
jgi:hypothetical protein